MEMFKGGLTAADIVRMCAEKQREKETKEKHDKENAAQSTEGESSDHVSHISIANLVATQIKEEIGGLESRIVSG